MERSPTLENNPLMTSSYHEINDTSDKGIHGAEGDLEISLPSAKRLFDKARNWVGDLSLEGVVTQEGQQVTYVTQDLTEKIKLVSSPVHEALEAEEVLRAPVKTPLSSELNVVINEIEVEAKKLASSIDTLTENLSGILHSLSSMTVDCIFTSSDGVTQLCDTADSSIKVMYQVMAKCEELNKSVIPLYKLHQQIKDTRRLLDKVEAEMS